MGKTVMVPINNTSKKKKMFLESSTKRGLLNENFITPNTMNIIFLTNLIGKTQ